MYVLASVEFRMLSECSRGVGLQSNLESYKLEKERRKEAGDSAVEWRGMNEEDGKEWEKRE